MCQLLVGLGDVTVLGVKDDWVDRPLEVHIQRPAHREVCGGCGAGGVARGSREVVFVNPALIRPPDPAGVAQAPLVVPVRPCGPNELLVVVRAGSAQRARLGDRRTSPKEVGPLAKGGPC